MQAQSNPTLHLPKEERGAVKVEISGVSNHLRKDTGYEHLAIYVKNKANEYTNPIQGRYVVEEDLLVFTPYYPFEKGLPYVVRVRNDPSGADYWFQDFQVGEKPSVEAAQLLDIYPSSEKLPENLLRLYFYFNTPMKKDQALQHIHLTDAEGNIDDQAFMEFKQELWSADGKRLTLLFDPGRIKRGVSTNVELGPALLEGHQYSLTISKNWKDVYDQKLGTTTRKTFEVESAYRTSIDINQWHIDPPEAESTQSLAVHIDRIMDHALVPSMIQIVDDDEQPIAGDWQISKEETTAHFVPDQRWKAGSYHMIFDHRLEDVAGNNLKGLLDQDSGGTHSHQALTRQFSIR